MNKQNIVIGGVIVAILLAVISFGRSGQGPAGQNGRNGQDGTSLGATPGDTVNSRTFDINGVQNTYDRVSYSSASSTLCVIPPPQATSTISKFTAKNTSATSSAVYLILEKRTNAYAPSLAAATSSNVVASVLLAAGSDEPFLVQATTTTTSTQTSVGAFDNLEVSPSQYLVLYAKSNNGANISQADGTSVFTGKCTSILLKE